MTLPELDCACAGIRRAARLVTQLYSREIGGGLEPTQFALLSAIDGHPGMPQAVLGRALGLDKTSLSRNLRLMTRNGWLELAPADDRRERGYRLTEAGAAVFARAKPQWRRAQAKLRAGMTAEEWQGVRKFVDVAATAALKALETSD